MSSYQNIQNKINRYLNNEMTDQERHAFEMECEQDPMLQDMLEGFNEFDITSSDLEQISKNKTNNTSEGFSTRNKWILFSSSLALLFVIAIVLYQVFNLPGETDQKETAALQNTDQKNTQEKIDTSSMQKINAVSSEKVKIEQEKISKKQIAQPIQDIDTVSQVVIDEPLSPLPKNNISIPENNILQSIVKKKVDIKIFHKFKAMSYDKIRRENILLVEDTKLGGLPASEEDHERVTGPLGTKVKVDYDDYINETLEMFSKEWYYRCIERCKIILSQYPNDVNAYFYGGMSLLNLKAYEESVPYFKGVINSPYNVFYEEALFYYGMALKHFDQPKAKEVFQQITNSDNFYNKRAQEQLNLLNN